MEDFLQFADPRSWFSGHLPAPLMALSDD